MTIKDTIQLEIKTNGKTRKLFAYVAGMLTAKFTQFCVDEYKEQDSSDLKELGRVSIMKPDFQIDYSLVDARLSKDWWRIELRRKIRVYDNNMLESQQQEARKKEIEKGEYI